MIRSIPRRACGVLVTTAAILGFLTTMLLLTVPPDPYVAISRPKPLQRPVVAVAAAAGDVAAAPSYPDSPSSPTPPPVTSTQKEGEEEREDNHESHQPLSQDHNNENNNENNKPKNKDTETKYFYEPSGMGVVHYDARYFIKPVPYAEHIVVLRNLVRSYLSMMRSAGIETWLAHGTLLGWWWNERIMPWDYDLDVQVNGSALVEMGERFNMTRWEFDPDTFRIGVVGDDERGEDHGHSDTNNDTNNDKTPRVQAVITPPPPPGRKRTYLLDVNPNSAERHHLAGHNVIDARWIDVANGMFVDITGLSELDPSGAPGVLSCKNNHHYAASAVFPLQQGEFEGVPALVPAAVEGVLAAEYGEKCMVETEWAGHTWDPKRREWVLNTWFWEE